MTKTGTPELVYRSDLEALLSEEERERLESFLESVRGIPFSPYDHVDGVEIQAPWPLRSRLKEHIMEEHLADVEDYLCSLPACATVDVQRHYDPLRTEILWSVD